jgi:hypothetical protein
VRDGTAILLPSPFLLEKLTNAETETIFFIFNILVAYLDLYYTSSDVVDRLRCQSRAIVSNNEGYSDLRWKIGSWCMCCWRLGWAILGADV